MTTTCRDCDDRSNAVGICAAHRVARQIQDDDYWASESVADETARSCSAALIEIVGRPWYWGSTCPHCGWPGDIHEMQTTCPGRIAAVALGIA